MTLPEAMVYLINGRRIMNDRIELSLFYGLLMFSDLSRPQNHYWRPYVPNIEDLKDESWRVL